MRFRIPAWLSILVLLALPLAAHAQEPGTGGRQIRLEDAPAGPYRVRALTSPIPPTVGELFVEVRVTDPAIGAVTEGVEVEILASPLEGEGTGLTVPARTDLAPTPREFAALLQVPEPGFWRVVVRVHGPQGSGQAEFVERVVANTHWIHILSVGAPLAGLLGLLWFYTRARRGHLESTSTEHSA
ncbi:MAG: hypothetical protein ACRDHY_04490 [Anaerolineales bacterium]